MLGKQLILGGLAGVHPVIGGVIALAAVLFAAGVVMLVLLAVVPLIGISVFCAVAAALGFCLAILSLPVLLVALPLWIGWKVLLR